MQAILTRRNGLGWTAVDRDGSVGNPARDAHEVGEGLGRSDRRCERVPETSLSVTEN
jgi:hypothetical protein